jgi:large subunit ribosomal protein L23
MSAAKAGGKAAGGKAADAKAASGRKPKLQPGQSGLSQEALTNLLLSPHVTEKTSLAMQNGNQYTFRVRRDANKTDVKAAVELMFDVKVAGVQVVNESGKTRRFGKTPGRTQDWKKAYVRLAAGQAIDYENLRKA